MITGIGLATVGEQSDPSLLSRASDWHRILDLSIASSYCEEGQIEQELHLS